MKWRLDRLRPTQPFFVFASDIFLQEVYLRQGISHFYMFHSEETKEIVAVPDGCIDIIFEFDRNKMKAYAAGSTLKYTGQIWEGKKEFFGVRFLPGFFPAGTNVVLKDLINVQIPLSDILTDKNTKIISRVQGESDFYQRIRVFIEEYTKFEKKEEKPYGKKELVMAVKDMVYESNGVIKVSDMSERSGYSERYINRVFIEQMGFSPKNFCKIIQFQRSIEVLNYGEPDNMTETAVNLGYYDQSQFIRDFKRYSGITPKQYLKLVEKNSYRARVKETNYL